MQKLLQQNTIQLIPLTQEHETVFIALANIPEINSRVNKPFPYGSADFAKALKSTWENKAFFVWMTAHEGEICGVINAASIRNSPVFQGGYWISPSKWKKGLASEALTLVKHFLIKECAAERLQALVEPDNLASIRVLEKCGYKKEGLLRKFCPTPNRGLLDVFMYAYVP